MKLVFWGNGNRGVACLKALYENSCDIRLVVAHPDDKNSWYESTAAFAEKLGIKTIKPYDTNDKAFKKTLIDLKPDLFVLAGYGKILSEEVINIPVIMSLNLHAGKLPEYRGSSPMNWALINGEACFSLSIIKIDKGVDSGGILFEKSFPISANDTINDLHDKANEEFPLMLIDAVSKIKNGSYKLLPQDNSKAGYYPLRFPEDGFISWDIYSALEVHNRVRALTKPYPCAFTFFKGRKVNLISSRLNDCDYFGAQGRIYRKSKDGILVCAKDKCLWIKEAVFADSGKSLFDEIEKYDKFMTIHDITYKFNKGD